MAKKDFTRYLAEIGGRHLLDDIRTAERISERYQRRYTVRKRGNPAWNVVGSVEQIVPFDRGLRLRCQHGWVELYWIAPDCLRVRLNPTGAQFDAPFSYAVHKVDWPPVAFELLEGVDALEMRTSSLVCRMGKRPFRMGLETLAHDLICIDAVGMQQRADGAVRLSLGMKPDESGYGLGERTAGLHLRGKSFSLWNSQPDALVLNADPLHTCIPFYLGVHQQGVYGLFWDNSSRGQVDVGHANPDVLSFEAETGELRYFLFAGSDVKQVLNRYTELTGRISLPPLWGLGYHQSRFSYESESDVLRLANELRARHVPCDAVYLDVQYMDGFRAFTWDTRRFEHFRQMITALHEVGLKVITVLNPAIRIDGDYESYRSGAERGVFLRYPDEQAVNVAGWGGLSCIPDFTAPAARHWWMEQIRILVQVGVDGFVNDMGEPSAFTSEGVTTLPDFIAHDYDGLGGTHRELHNVYGMLMARASHEGMKRLRSGLRSFNVARAGYTGGQRYAASLMSSNASDWESLRLSLSMSLNMGLSGVALAGTDVGGFDKDATGELLTRWLQAASLMPYFRSHSASGTQRQEPWAFGQPYEVINRLAIALRYRLMPYLYAVTALCKEYGWPIIRPLFMAEPQNQSLRGIDDCYLVGDALLVAPVLHPGVTRRSVYLPMGSWYDYWTNELHEGGQQVTVPAPLERLPLFVRGGAVIPHWPEMRFAGEQDVETLIYRVYPGEFETILYEDAGEGLAYEDGDYRWLYITVGWDEGRLLIDRRVAGRFTPPYQNMKVEVVGFESEPTRVRIDRQGAPLWFYDDGLLELTTETFQRIEITRKTLPGDRTVMRRPW
jgi:alpha-glucosidase